MRARSAVLSALTAVALSAPFAFAADAPAPQVTDATGDANLSATVSTGGEAAPVGNQAYADVVSALWQPVTTKVGKKTQVTGFTATLTLAGPPTPPAGTTVVYRVLGEVAGDSTLFLGPVFYTSPGSDPSQPQAALRDNLGSDKVTRLTKIDLPKVEGSTITWTVPLSVLPKEFKLGSKLGNLYVTVNEIEDFHGQKVPDGVPSYGGAYGLGAGVVDSAYSEASFQIG